MKVSIVYWSGTGNTEAMANAVAEGAKNAGAEVELCNVSQAGDVSDCDVLLLGCPAMGSEELEESEFEPFFSSVEGSLSGKKVGLFRGRTHLQQRAGRRRSCRLPRARRKSGKVREYAQNHIGSRGNALRYVRNARQRRRAPCGWREESKIFACKGQDGSDCR